MRSDGLIFIEYFDAMENLTTNIFFLEGTKLLGHGEFLYPKYIFPRWDELFRPSKNSVLPKINFYKMNVFKFTDTINYF
jgi:hypothetical protein